MKERFGLNRYVVLQPDNSAGSDLYLLHLNSQLDYFIIFNKGEVPTFVVSICVLFFFFIILMIKTISLKNGVICRLLHRTFSGVICSYSI